MQMQKMLISLAVMMFSLFLANAKSASYTKVVRRTRAVLPPTNSHPGDDSLFVAPKYDFEWQVQDEESGNDYGHQESRDDKSTTGVYYVQLPDGRKQKVSYTVEGPDGGFQATVTYEGEETVPSSDSAAEKKPESSVRPLSASPIFYTQPPAASNPVPSLVPEQQQYQVPQPQYQVPPQQQYVPGQRVVYRNLY